MHSVGRAIYYDKIINDRTDKRMRYVLIAFTLSVVIGCASGGGSETGTGGASSVAGHGGTTGAGGEGGTPERGGTTGTAGTVGSGGSAGHGGTTGAAGSTSTAGTGGGGAGGMAGATGAGGTGGTSGSGGVGGSVAGRERTGGAAGRGGMGGGVAGSGGNGSGGSAGSAGSAGGRGGSAGGTSGSGAGGSAGTSAILGATPPMGWNSWNTFGCNNLNETLIKQVADTFVSSGMKDVGYQYVNLDDCWMDGRDSSGKLKWNATKFPGGIPALADYIHGKGLKIGIYEVPGDRTCANIYGGYSQGAGSLGHETTDAQTFAAWGIDYLKYDKCTAPLSGFATMASALKAAGRPIFYSINPGDGSGCPPGNCSIDASKIANMWRIGFDINGSWSSMIGLVDLDKNLYQYAGPGHWNDPDMMEVGNGLTDTEGRTHFSMWAILAAPLIAGNDIRSMSATTKATLTNAEVIAVDQDPLGMQGRLVASPATNLEVWSKTLSGTNVRAVALLNRGGSAASITVQWSAIGIPTGAATVRDLWSHTDLGSFTGSYTASSVPSHGVTMIKVTSTP
jgi:alpha-galactosidase